MNAIFKPKLFVVLKQGYNFKIFQKDLFAGLIVGVVALPLAIAFAVASGVSPEKGLITAVIAGFIVSFLGGSRFQIGGPTGAFVVIVYGIVQKYGLDGLMISTIMAGLMLVGFGLLRLGVIIKYVPHPLVVGFTSGIALIIFSTQVKDALGLQLADIPTDFISKWITYFSQFSQTNFTALGITAVTIVMAVYGGRIFKKVPGSFLAIVLVTVVVNFFALPVQTIQSVFGEIPNTIHLQTPHFEWSSIRNYIQPAFTIAILGAIESLLSAVVADGMSGGSHRSNTELIAQGIANIFTPFLGGIPATGAIARTAANIKNGARTPIAGVVHAITLLLIMLVFSKWAALIPMSCLAGILIVVAYNMSEWRSFVAILKGSHYDILVLLIAFILTVFVDLTIAIEVGMVLSAMLFMQRMSKLSNIETVDIDSDILENYSNIPKGIDIYEITGPFFFGAAQSYKETLKEIAGDSKVLILRMRHVPFVDATGIRMFQEVIRDFKIRKVKVILSGVRPEVKQTLIDCGLVDIIDTRLVCANFGEAVIKATEYLEEINRRKIR
ncbi:MAG: sulfate permease [Bacteroidia bacterium]|nr:sulfate permease [Bacteroidia bacterium]